MRTITIRISDQMEKDLNKLLEAMNKPQRFMPPGPHPMTMDYLAFMLLEDASMVASRPGSWEGGNMAQVLNAHGYLL